MEHWSLAGNFLTFGELHNLFQVSKEFAHLKIFWERLEVQNYDVKCIPKILNKIICRDFSGIGSLEMLKYLGSNIQKLHICNMALSPEIARFQKLEELLVFECTIDSLEFINQLSFLHRLVLHNTLVPIKFNLEIPLKSLMIANCKVDYGQLPQTLERLIIHTSNIPVLGSLINLTELYIKSDEEIEELSTLLKLKTLCITEITDENVGNISGCVQLEELVIEKCSTASLKWLTSFPKLEQLEISCELKTLPILPIKYLNVYHDISEEDFITVSQFPQLERFDVYCPLDNRFMHLIHLKSLKYLGLRNPDSIEPIVPYLEQMNLQTLKVYRSSINSDILNRLKYVRIIYRD